MIRKETKFSFSFRFGNEGAKKEKKTHLNDNVEDRFYEIETRIHTYVHTFKSRRETFEKHM